MDIFGVHPLTVITVKDHKGLRQAWKRYGGAFPLVGEFVVRKPLTESQLRRLPEGLRALVRTADDVSFLERLYRLPDPRTSSE